MYICALQQNLVNVVCQRCELVFQLKEQSVRISSSFKRVCSCEKIGRYVKVSNMYRSDAWGVKPRVKLFGYSVQENLRKGE